MKEKSSGPPKTTDQSTSHFYNGGRNANLAKTTFSHGNSTLVSTMFGKLIETESQSPGILSKGDKRSFEIEDYQNDNRRCSDLQVPFAGGNTTDPYQIVSALKAQNHGKMTRTGMNF